MRCFVTITIAIALMACLASARAHALSDARVSFGLGQDPVEIFNTTNAHRMSASVTSPCTLDVPSLWWARAAFYGILVGLLLG